MQDQNEVGIRTLTSFDDKPIGARIKFEIPEYAENEYPHYQNQIKNPEPQPLNKRINSKIWKIKKEAFEQLLGMVRNDPLTYRQFESQTIQFLTFNHALVQDRALKVLQVYLTSGCGFSLQPKLIIRSIIEKCLTLEKDQIRQLAYQILFWFMDNKFQQILLLEVNDELMTKNPKILAITYNFLAILLSNYGIKRLKNLEKFEKNLTILSSVPKPLAKQNAIQFFKQVYRWMGENMLKDFKINHEIKDQVVKFAKQYARVPMQIKRGLKKQGIEGRKLYNMQSQDEQNEEPVDVLLMYTPKWVDDVIEIQKWKDKKQILDEFIKKIRVACITPRQISHFITLIKRLLTENNINLLLCGFIIVQNMAKGLKRHFSTVCKSVQTLIFSKLKDGKSMIVEACQNTLKSIMNCLQLEQLLDDIKAGLDDKAASMRLQILKFLMNFANKKQVKISNCLKQLLDKISKLTEDGSGEVRNQSLQLLCEIKKTHDMKFFGDKLKNIGLKKFQTIQNACVKEEDREMMEIEQNYGSFGTIVGSKQFINLKQKKIINKENSNIKLMIQESSVVSSENRNKTVKPLNNFYLNDISSQHESIRLNAYQNIAHKMQLTNDFIYTLKSKAAKQSSPSILKTIIQIIKKYSNGETIQLESIEFLGMHDWKKCRNLIVDFINNHKFTPSAQEYIKNLNLSTSNLKSSNSLIQNNQQMNIKLLTMELQNLIPKMSNPHRDTKLEAADNAIKMVQLLPKVASQSDLVAANGWNQDLMNQFYNVTKFRISQNDSQIINRFCRLLIELIHKNIAIKGKGIKLIIPTLIARLSQNIDDIKSLMVEIMNSSPTFIFNLISGQICNIKYSQSLIKFILQNSQSFIKYAELKSYFAPLLFVIFNYNISARVKENCEKLLDQMVELCGQATLEQQVVKKNKISNAKQYLEKYNISLDKYSSPTQNSQSKGNIKTERLKSQEENPWPIVATPSHILKLINILVSLKQPLATLATPLTCGQEIIQLIQRFEPAFLMESSDLLLKWVYWRMIIDPKQQVCEILKFASKIVSVVNFELSQAEVIILLSSLVNCFKRFKRDCLQIIEQIHSKLFMLSEDLKQKSFRFWINLLSDTNVHNPPTDEILQILVRCYADLIGAQIVTLARIPLVLKNADFNQYLTVNFDSKLLNVYGFKSNDTKISKNSSELKLLSDLSGSENIINITVSQKSQYYNIFQKLSSNQMKQKIEDIIENGNGQLIETNLKIMYSIIVPFLRRQISYINVYTYFQYFNNLISVNSNTAGNGIKFESRSLSNNLLNLTRTFLYFLIDLDQSSFDNKNELIKIINKTILLILDQAESKIMLETLFNLLAVQIKMSNSNKILHLIPKCIGKASKSIHFKSQAGQIIFYILQRTIELMKSNEIQEGHLIVKSLKIMLNQIFNNHKQTSQHIFQEILNKKEIYLPARALIKDVLTTMIPEEIPKNLIESQNIKKQLNPIKNISNFGFMRPGNKEK